ncbi:unnamed protein product [Arabidopsis halleri]
MCFIGLEHRRLSPSSFFGSERQRLCSRWLGNSLSSLLLRLCFRMV